MGNISDELSSNMFVSIIFGVPILLGIIILLLPLVFVSAAADIPLDIFIKNMLVFGIAVFIVWILCRHQIIENGIVGIIAGSFVYSHFAWHPVFCIIFFLENLYIRFCPCD